MYSWLASIALIERILDLKLKSLSRSQSWLPLHILPSNLNQLNLKMMTRNEKAKKDAKKNSKLGRN